MNHLFSRLLRLAPEKLLTPKHDFPVIMEVIELPKLAETSLLRLPQGYSAGFIQRHQQSALFASGEHRITSQTLMPLNPKNPLTLIYLCRHHVPQRQWQTHYQCPISNRIIELSGQYSYHISAEPLFFQHLTRHPEYRELNALDTRISASIRGLLIRQAIPIDDIENYTERFTSYLKDALSLLMAEIGLLPNHFSIESLKPKNQSMITSDVTIDTAEETTQNITTETLDELPAEPREYYIAKRGIQQGPYNNADLQRLIRNGELHKQTLIWKQGMHSWQTAQNHPQLYWYDQDTSHDSCQ